jgi:hypothetical protein
MLMAVAPELVLFAEINGVLLDDAGDMDDVDDRGGTDDRGEFAGIPPAFVILGTGDIR